MGQISGKLDPLATYIRLYYPLPNHFSQNTPEKALSFIKLLSLFLQQNSPINFHLLNFDGRMGDSDNAADDEDDEA
jgi:hypothetical protein